MNTKDKQRQIREGHAKLRALRGGADKPKRLTLADAYTNLAELFGAVLTRQTARHPTEGVEITRNAKGDPQFRIEGQTAEGETLAECAARVAALYDVLHARFPVNGAEKPAEATRRRKGATDASK